MISTPPVRQRGRLMALASWATPVIALAAYLAFWPVPIQPRAWQPPADAGLSPNVHLQAPDRAIPSGAQRPDVLFPGAGDRRATEDDLFDLELLHRLLEIVETTTYRHAPDPLASLLGVVVDESHRIQVPVRVETHLPHEQTAERAGAINQHARSVLAA